MNVTAALPELPPAVRRRARRFRAAALVILLLGLVVAGLVYWRTARARARDDSDDPSTLGFNRAEQRQMELLYGKQGQLLDDLEARLQQPGTRAVLVVLGAAVLALGCYQFSRVLESEAGGPVQADKPPE